jgi:hypothetical protein
MKRMILLSAMLFVLAQSRSAHADYISSSGAECVAPYSSTVSYASNYVTNTGASTLSVNCPLNLGAIATTSSYQTQVIVRYVDNNTGQALRCEVNKETATMQQYNGNSMYSCSTAGGCTAPQTSYTGVGAYLLLTPPSTTFSIDDSITVHCEIPASQSGAQSGIIAYYAQ